MSVAHRNLLDKLKEVGEDFEWYPTTNEIIRVLYKDIHGVYSEEANYPKVTMLDIGAGNGKVFSVMGEISEGISEKSQKLTIGKAYAIEKSQTLINAMPDDIFVVGTNFWNQTLIDKKVDLIFSNPPYSEYDTFSEKIIKEANAQYIYLVIPQRWKECKRISLALEKRGAKAEVVSSFTFEKSEDRQARAKVDLVKINLKKYAGKYGHAQEQEVDPFVLWFKETYPMPDESKESSQKDTKAKMKEKIKSVVKGRSLVEGLEELYNDELRYLHRNYTAASVLDPELLKEMGITHKKIMESLEQKIAGTKNLYWQELFNNLESITTRLTKKSRDSILSTLLQNTSVDFTAENAYTIVIWAIKRSNRYYDSQLQSLYADLSKMKNIRNYKSNKRVIRDDWRYLKDGFSHYALDYRIVVSFYNLLGSDYAFGTVNGLICPASELIRDVIVVANNLGFRITSDVSDASMQWVSQHKNNFYFKTTHDKVPLKIGAKTSLGKIEDVSFIEETKCYQYKIDGEWMHHEFITTEQDIFLEAKAFKNGNLHLKFNKKFMKALNIEAARLNRWIKTPEEACEEFDITEKEASMYFESNFVLTPSKVPLLG